MWLLLACLAVTGVGYAPSLDAFWTSDDFAVLHLHQLAGSWIQCIAVPKGAPFFRPLMSASLCLDEGLFGRVPLAFRAHSVLLLALSAWGLGWLVAALTNRFAAGVAAAMFYAVCPLHHEAVSWVAARGHGLGAFFVVLMAVAALVWLRRGGIGWLAAALAAGACSLLAVEAAAPLVLCIPLAWAFLGEGTRGRRRGLGVAAVALLAAYATVRTVVIGGIGGYHAADGTNVHMLVSLGRMVRYTGLVLAHLLVPGPWCGAHGAWGASATAVATAANVALLVAVPWRPPALRLAAGVACLLFLSLCLAVTWARLDANLAGSRLLHLPLLVAAAGLGACFGGAWSADGWRRWLATAAVVVGIAAQLPLLRQVNGWWGEAGGLVQAMLAGIGSEARARGAHTVMVHGVPVKHHGAEVAGRGLEGAVILFVDPGLTLHVIPDPAAWQYVLSVHRAEGAEKEGVLVGEWRADERRWNWR
ncbi:MAG TPA: hypothetical protein VK081_14390 [Planctomycetota bacterium]|nr:hypothetical protein [Planctomycetota bacterium]